MKNIHILPTTQPSNLLLCIKSYTEHKDTPAENSDNKGNFRLGFGIYANKVFYQPHHIYITSNEEIKRGDCILVPNSEIIILPTGLSQVPLSNFSRGYSLSDCKKIILTTDQDLIKDGVQGIDDDFLEWFVNNPSCENVEVLRCPIEGLYAIIPKEEIQPQQIWNEEKMEGVTKLIQEQETLEEVAEKEASLFYEKGSLDWNKYRQVFIEGAKWQQERSYSEEDMNLAFETGRNFQLTGENNFKELLK